MRASTRSMAVATVAGLSLILSACSGDDGGNNNGGGSGGDPNAYEAPTETGEAPDEIVVRGCNPENPLVPQNTAETCGGNPQDLTVAKLIHYDVENAEPTYDIAESIETDDNQNFTITIKEDYMFSDGTPVTADSFVDAWNYAAWGPNGYQANYFFEPFAGYDELQCTGDNADNPCAGNGQPSDDDEAMDGLEVVDERTFTIQTKEKVSNLEVRLGYTAFAPLPESFFDDPDAFGQQPVSAGPYQVENWQRNQQIVLTKNPEYSGEFGGQSERIVFKIYNNDEAAYADLQAGNLDVLDVIPTESLTDDLWLEDLEDRGSTRSVGVIQMLGINPEVDEGLSDPRLRQAISMAIDRQALIDQLFAGTRNPATGWVSPVVDGYEAGACGEYCEHDPDQAKELWDEAGGYDGTLELHFNGDGGHQEWTEAACNMIRDALDTECTATPTVDFATFLTALDNRETSGMWRYGWQMDYPSIENFLVPLYSEGAASNYFDYANDDFRRLTTEAAAADTLEEANELYQEAERLLAEDMRAIPLMYSTAPVGWSERLNPVAINAFGVPDYANVTLAE